jgi:hypothetical protein
MPPTKPSRTAAAGAADLARGRSLRSPNGVSAAGAGPRLPSPARYCAEGVICIPRQLIGDGGENRLRQLPVPAKRALICHHAHGLSPFLSAGIVVFVGAKHRARRVRRGGGGLVAPRRRLANRGEPCSGLEQAGRGAAIMPLKLKQTAGQRESQPACPVYARKQPCWRVTWDGRV